MNIRQVNPSNKAVAAKRVFETEHSNVTVIQILKDELLKSHITKTPAFLICVFGEVVFENENFQPNDSTEGWDGFFNGEKMNPAVFVYFAEIEFKDGRKIIYKGDVALRK